MAQRPFRTFRKQAEKEFVRKWTRVGDPRLFAELAHQLQIARTITNVTPHFQREEGEFGFIFNKVPRLAEGAPRSVPRGRRSGGGDSEVMAPPLPGREEADTEEVEKRGEEVEERGEEVEEGGEEEGEGDDFSMGVSHRW